MTYSYTQISQYLTCPRRYKHPWRPGYPSPASRRGSALRPSLRTSPGSLLPPRRRDCCLREWAACQNQGLQYSKGDTWDRRIESAEFLPHSGIRFPQNPCSSCPYLGLCLGRQDLVEAALIRRPGAEDLGWLDELAF